MANRRLDTLGEIAQYLNRNQSTVLRWARDRGFPLHRLPGGKRHTVCAYTDEIDAWMVNGKKEGVRNSGLGIREEEAGLRSQESGLSEERTGSERPNSIVSSQPPAFSPENGNGDAKVAFEDEGLVPDPPVSAIPGKDIEKAGADKNNLDKDPKRDELSPWMAAVVPRGRRRFFLHLALAGSVVAVLAVAYILARPPAVPRVLGFTQLTNDGLSKGGGLVTDGAYLYFPELTPSGYVISKISTAGGDPIPISAEFQVPSIQALNHHRGELLITDPASVEGRPNLWALPIAGGPRRPVGTIQTHSAAWVPEGDAILYAEGKDVFRCGLDGSGSQKIAALSGLPSAFRWSPDGKSIRLTLDFIERHGSEIWEMKSDGSNPHPLFSNLSGLMSPFNGDWTRDERYFVFGSHGDPTPDLWAVREGRGFWGPTAMPRQLTAGPMAIGAGIPGNDERTIFVVGVDSQRKLFRWEERGRRFLPYLSNLTADEVDYSRDGKWMAYLNFRDRALWKRRADGTQPAPLTFSFHITELPRWSPDGKWIAFMGLKTATDIWRIYVIPAEGGEPRVVLPSDHPQGAPTWSPDGKRVAFGELPRDQNLSSWHPVIHIVDLAANRETTLAGSEGLWTARWSPDGRTLAALTTDSKTIKLCDLRSGHWQDVAAAAQVTDMNWTHDSSTLYFEDILPPSGPAVYRVSLRDRRVEKVTDYLGVSEIQSAWLGFAPDGSLLVSGPVGSSEIYSMEVEWP